MATQLNAFSTDGQVILTFPEAAMKSEDREEFISFAKAEWLARQSRLTEVEATDLAESIDSDWWKRNRDRVLANIAAK
jgi:hypothetical protein